jgi:hypothetical protein
MLIIRTWARNHEHSCVCDAGKRDHVRLQDRQENRDLLVQKATRNATFMGMMSLATSAFKFKTNSPTGFERISLTVVEQHASFRPGRQATRCNQ